jgi:phenylalanyl-tRNA synthetase alpha chain
VTEIEDLRAQALGAIEGAEDLERLDEVRVRFVGRRSELVAAQRALKDLPAEERKERGKQLNELRTTLQAALDERHEVLAAAALEARLAAERLDLTLPPRRIPPGRPHLLTQVEQEIVDVFVGMGYRVAEGPEAEAGAYNFDLLNIPPDHPARQEMDTIYVAGYDDVVLRTHTSPVQARVMTTQQPPVAVVVPGRVYRADSVDATHSPVFTQVEGLLVDTDITMAHLRGTLLAFSRSLFGADREIRLRPSFFPFTEPSAEIDVSCGFCDGQGPTMPGVLLDRLDRDPRCRHGRPQRAHPAARPGEVSGLRLRHRHRAGGDAAQRRGRHPRLLRRRRPLPGPVLGRDEEPPP